MITVIRWRELKNRLKFSGATHLFFYKQCTPKWVFHRSSLNHALNRAACVAWQIHISPFSVFYHYSFSYAVKRTVFKIFLRNLDKQLLFYDTGGSNRSSLTPRSREGSRRPSENPPHGNTLTVPKSVNVWEDNLLHFRSIQSTPRPLAIRCAADLFLQ